MTHPGTWILDGLGILWVFVWGFLIYRKPTFFAGAGGRDATPERMRLIQRLGVLAMVLAALSLVNLIRMAALHRLKP